MITAPLPFQDALDFHEVKSLLPTSGNSAALSQLEPAIKRRAMFSATVALAAPLQQLRDGVDAILAGKSDVASERLKIKELWAKLGYTPEEGKEGSLQDLSSTQRINLQIQTNVAVARGAGWYQQGMQPEVLDEYPAQELYRAIIPKGGVDAERDWPERWQECGGKFYGDRMIALKTDPIWDQLGDPSRFPDGLDNPWPPFAFNSGMFVRDIDRDEAEDLGLISANSALLPKPLDLVADLAALPLLRETWLKTAITESGLGHFVAGVLDFLDGFRTAANSDQPRDDHGRWSSEPGGPPSSAHRSDSLGRLPPPGVDHLADADNIERGRAAIARLQSRQAGSVPNAMFVRGVGPVEFAWGNTGDKTPDANGLTHKDGGGIAHIADKHPTDLMKVPEVLAKGEVTAPIQDPASGRWKRTVVYQDQVVKLSSQSAASPRHWLITGYTP